MITNSLIVGTSGAVGVEGVEQVIPSGVSPTLDIVKIVVQVVIGLATLLGIFRNKPKQV